MKRIISIIGLVALVAAVCTVGIVPATAWETNYTVVPLNYNDATGTVQVIPPVSTATPWRQYIALEVGVTDAVCWAWGSTLTTGQVEEVVSIPASGTLIIPVPNGLRDGLSLRLQTLVAADADKTIKVKEFGNGSW